jgi:hypothetical protein
MSANGSSLTGTGATVSVGSSVQGTTIAEIQNISTRGDAAITSGDFTVGYSGQTTSPILHNASANDMKIKLENMTTIGAVTVTRASNSNNGYTWMVTFLTEGGDLSIMTATNNINGAWTGAGAQVACTEVVKGVGRSDVSDLFTFSASLGNVVTGAWSSATQLVLTIVDAGDGATYDQTRVGGLRMTVKATANLRTADESSPQSTDESDTLTGTWGVHDAPYILSFTAANTGGNAGLGNADTLTVTFNKNTNQPPVGTRHKLTQCLMRRFHSVLPTLAHGPTTPL